jgi:hypothetical protein
MTRVPDRRNKPFTIEGVFMQTVLEDILGEELERGLIQAGRDLEYLLFIDSKRRTAEWSMRLHNAIALIERARESGFTDDQIRTAVAIGLFPDLLGGQFD